MDQPPIPKEARQFSTLLNQVIADKYIRIQSQLKIASPDMDNITSKNIRSLQQEANAMVEDNQKVIEKFCIEILNI